MRKFSIISAVILGLLITTRPIPAVTSINANNFIQIISSTSQYVRIEGKVFDSKLTDNSKVVFLNFGKNFNTSLSAVIYNTNFPAFIDAGIEQPDLYFKNKNVVIEGIVRICNGKPEIIINSPDQIKVVED